MPASHYDLEFCCQIGTPTWTTEISGRIDQFLYDKLVQVVAQCTWVEGRLLLLVSTYLPNRLLQRKHTPLTRPGVSITRVLPLYALQSHLKSFISPTGKHWGCPGLAWVAQSYLP